MERVLIGTCPRLLARPHPPGPPTGWATWSRMLLFFLLIFFLLLFFVLVCLV
jgi:hypothetical protein